MPLLVANIKNVKDPMIMTLRRTMDLVVLLFPRVLVLLPLLLLLVEVEEVDDDDSDDSSESSIVETSGSINGGDSALESRSCRIGLNSLFIMVMYFL